MVRQLTAVDLGFDEEEEPLDVLDLPQLYSRPSATTLLATLTDLKSQPSSWETTPRSGNSRSISGASTPQVKRRKVKSKGVPAYLTKIVSSGLQWIDDDATRERIWEVAAQELSVRSGRTAQGDLTRVFEIPLSAADEEDDDVDTFELTVYEPALTADNLGHKTWASSFMLSKRLCRFKNEVSTDSVLELGAGTGLVGMAASCVFKTHVIMTDLPEILTNLERNLNDNAAMLCRHGGTTTAAVLDWEQPDSLLLKGTPCLPQTFSLILAADVLYSSEHPPMLARTIQYHLRKNAEARLLLETPLRDGYNAELELLQQELATIGLVRVQEGEELGVDDWSRADDDESIEVRCWWSLWKWS